MSEQNPYVSPSTPQPYGDPLQEAKPASIKVFGILNLMFGAFGICGTIGTMAMLFFMPVNPNIPNPALDLMQSNPAYRAFMICSLGLGFIFVVILILSGIGLLKNRQIGRKLAIWYGCYAIFSAIVGTVVNVVFVLGPMMAQANQGGPESAAAIGGFVGGLVGGCLGLIYPILLLVFMNKRKVVEALE